MHPSVNTGSVYLAGGGHLDIIVDMYAWLILLLQYTSRILVTLHLYN